MREYASEIAEIIGRGPGWIPGWAMSLLVYALALLLALLAAGLLQAALNRIVRGRDLFWRSLVRRTRRPLRLAVVIVAFVAAAQVAPLSQDLASVIEHGLLVAILVLAGWVVHVALQIGMVVYQRRFMLDAEDNLLARKHVTQSRILLRVANVLTVMVTAAAVLMTFDSVRQYGVSLLASAGAAGIVVGLALQPVLKNLLAGIQLAVTQPIRIDDALIVEGEWGRVEEITATYVVVRIWDWRRLIVPLSYFMERPFQNWTRESASLIGSVHLYLDHRADIGRLREEGRAVVGSSALWDGDVYNCAVTDIRERVIEVRILASAGSAGRAFDLRCEIRERLLAWIQSDMPQALPRTRQELTSDPDRGSPRDWQILRSGTGPAG